MAFCSRLGVEDVDADISSPHETLIILCFLFDGAKEVAHMSKESSSNNSRNRRRDKKCLNCRVSPNV